MLPQDNGSMYKTINESSIEEHAKVPLRKQAARFMTQREAAAYFGVSEATLKNWGAPCVFIGRKKEREKGCRVRYDVEKVCEWLEENCSCEKGGEA